ncbi:MAG TPA: MmcQ/YjbR family DNA-binding protein [Chitinophagaceae bacterium]|nr:MmcQ/YjbR family DNA-binding protein [Chitinophagaceae bacterium]
MTIDFLEKFCSKLPGVTTDIKWDNDLCFSVGGKMFCVASLDAPLKISFKVPDDEFDELSVREGFIPAPYMARAKWVMVTEPGKVNKKEWEKFVKQSYELVKAKLTKKQQNELR